jgi:1-phosphofructokinase
MVAGFLAGWIEKNDYNYALKVGIAAGSASTFSENLAEKNEIEALYALL